MEFFYFAWEIFILLSLQNAKCKANDSATVLLHKFAKENLSYFVLFKIQQSIVLLTKGISYVQLHNCGHKRVYGGRNFGPERLKSCELMKPSVENKMSLNYNLQISVLASLYIQSSQISLKLVSLARDHVSQPIQNITFPHLDTTGS